MPTGGQPPMHHQGPAQPNTLPPHGGQGAPGLPPTGTPAMPPNGGPGAPPPPAPQGHRPPPAPSRPEDEPVFPVDAMGATQNLNAVPGPGAATGDRPLYRDEVPEDAGADTAQFDVRGVQDYDDDYDDYDDQYPQRPSNRRGLIMGAGFVALLVVAGGGAFYFASGGFGSGGANAVTVADEGSDQGALAPDTLFPAELEIDGQGAFSRVAVDDNEDCAAGTHGDYGQVLTDNDCRQLVRASYLSEDQNHAVTVGIAAMPSDAEAETALGAQDLVGAQWFAGLPGEEGSPAERLGYSGGHGSSGQWGRYLLFSLSANSDGSDDDSDGEGAGATELRDIGEGFIETAHEALAEDRA
ncbi:hypothetical protein H4W79_004354 [Nocardiopsis terrae]|uniref:Uncharacterized protein n=1 Tax=Nocardiopsis terrae TaxID=372655 RepID=A0ABR9HMR3_9ACTN|nr:hypothetical protein [Nocardiopsis terrae]MBE1460140.1 hypothetical protein [Nocardiopsis terrae]